MSRKGCLIIIVIIAILLILLLACAGICVLIGSALSSYEDASLSSDTWTSKVLQEGDSTKVVVIDIEGVIMDSDEGAGLWASAAASSNTINTLLDKAITDESVKAIILNMNTPGGDVYASDLIYKKIQEAQADGLKVVTLMRGVAASGGYYIAATSDSIIASPFTFTGSIGVVMEVQSLDGLYKKLGIDKRYITNSGGDFKTGEGLFDDDPSGEEDQIYQEIIDETFDRFISVIVEGRNLSRAEVLEIADGRVLTGTQAQKLKLVDELGDFDTALAEAMALADLSNPTVITYQANDFWSMLAGYMGPTLKGIFPSLTTVEPQIGPTLKYLYVDQQ